MSLSFDFELQIDIERYERCAPFQMSGYSYFDHVLFTGNDCFPGMKLVEDITLIEVMRAQDSSPIALRLLCDEADIHIDPQSIEHVMYMGDELYVSNVNYTVDFYYRLKLRRKLQYEDNMKGSLIWVDEKDNETGYGEKLSTHRERILHRAFSVFIYNWKIGKMLLQCRADNKYHSGGLWCNACCSHSRVGETMTESIKQRLHQELGYQCDLTIADPDYSGNRTDANRILNACGSFVYHADLGGIGEDELDHVFLLFTDWEDISDARAVSFDPDEVKDVRWLSLREIEEALHCSHEAFSAWFQPAYDLALKTLKRIASQRGIGIGL